MVIGYYLIYRYLNFPGIWDLEFRIFIFLRRCFRFQHVGGAGLAGGDAL